MLENALENKWLFRAVLNESTEGLVLITAGKLFHSMGAFTEKARLPYFSSLYMYLGHLSLRAFDERKDLHGT